MKVGVVIVEILMCEGIDVIFGYLCNVVLEQVVVWGICMVIVCQECIGLYMVDVLLWLMCGRWMGVFVMQYGLGIENVYGGVVQVWFESVLVLVLL